MLRIFPATTEGHFHDALALIEEMARWDAEESRRVGLDGDAVVGFFYSSRAHNALIRESTAPEGCLLLASAGGDAPAGCGAFKRIDKRACELLHLYVCPEYRGRRIARQLVEQLMQVAANAGYRRMLLETATFMGDAQKLYASLGFSVRNPYREIPAAFLPFTVCMESPL